MNKYFISISCLLFSGLLCPCNGNAQDNGIKFETGLSWQQIQAKASAEHKLIFMDCYATWCGPCKAMEQYIYPDSTVRAYFNAHFINVKAQLDKTSKDSPELRAWYTTADSLRKLYQINAYPTFLFFSADGKALHKIIGFITKAEFIDQASDALDPQRQYFTLVAGWKEHQADSAYLLHAILAAKAVQDDEHARMMVNDYVQCLHDPVTRSTIQLVGVYISSESDKGFELFLKNATRIDTLFRNGIAERTLAEVIFKEEVVPILSDKSASVNWNAMLANLINKYNSIDRKQFTDALDNHFKGAISDEVTQSLHQDGGKPGSLAKLQATLKKRFPSYDCGLILLSDEVIYYYKNKLWDESARTAITLIDRYGDQMKPSTINDVIWRCIFLHSSDQKILNKALKDMDDAVKRAPDDITGLDTYANLLYKVGKKQQGIEIEARAAKLDPDDKDIAATLEKMRKGEQTWTGDSE